MRIRAVIGILTLVEVCLGGCGGGSVGDASSSKPGEKSLPRPVALRMRNFSISLPREWEEMPKEAVDKTNGFYRHAFKLPLFEHGFRRPGGPGRFFPQILTQRLEFGRLSRAILREAAAKDVDETSDVRKASRTAQFTMTDAVLVSQRYDEAANVVWSTFTLRSLGLGEARELQALIPTEKGLLVFMAIAPEPEYESLEPEFRRILESITVAPELAYRPRWYEVAPILRAYDWHGEAGQVALGVGLCLGIGGLLACISMLARRRGSRAKAKPDESVEPPDPPVQLADDAFSYYLARAKAGDEDEAFHHLRQLGVGAMPAFWAAFRREADPEIRALLAASVDQFRHPSTLDFFAFALLDPDPRVWQQALDAFIAQSSPESLKALRDAAAAVDDADRRAWIDEAVGQIEQAIAERGPDGRPG